MCASTPNRPIEDQEVKQQIEVQKGSRHGKRYAKRESFENLAAVK